MRNLIFTSFCLCILFWSCSSNHENNNSVETPLNTLEGRWAFQGVSWDSEANSAPGLAALAWLNVLSENNRLVLHGDSFQWVAGDENGLNGRYVVHNDSLILEYKNKSETYLLKEKSDSAMVLQNAEGGRLQLKKVSSQ